MDKNKWGYNLNNSDYWQCSWFDTKEEVIQAGRDEREELEIDCDTFNIGQLEKYVPSVDLDTLIDCAGDNAYDECGEAAESWLNTKYISKEVLEKFNVKLNKLFNEFLVEANEVPSFGHIVNVEVVDAKPNQT